MVIFGEKLFSERIIGCSGLNSSYTITATVTKVKIVQISINDLKQT